MTVTHLITGAFRLAASRYPELQKTWIAISWRVGAKLPKSLLMSSIQRTGELDMVLRCMEDDFTPPQEGAEGVELFSGHYQVMLSELWVGAIYEIFRLLKSRELIQDDELFEVLSHELRLLRIPLEKYEIASDRKLLKSLELQKHPPNGDETDYHQYEKNDPKRAHIMPAAVSDRGSVMWHVIDVESEKSYWLERRSISERIISLWGPNAESGK